MGAIRPHKTPVDTESDWDGPAEVAEAPNDADVLRYMHAWVDDEGDPDAKTSYKFPHHEAGTDTPANINAVNNALARLSQADIPDADRAGVEAHLRAHRRDAGLEDKVENIKPNTRQPIRCFEGNAKPYEPFWRIVNAENSETGEPEIELYGYISEYSWFDDDITPKMFKDDLYRTGGGGPVTIRLNSYGGDVIAASLMHTIIRDYPGRVTVQIDGIAASAATVVAVAGDVVRIQETGYFMVHDPSVVFLMAQLNIEDLTRMANALKAIKEGILNAYVSKTGLSRERLSRLMTEETWMDAQKALDLGFVDEIIHYEKPIPIQLPQGAAVVNALRNYSNLPTPIAQALENTNILPSESSALTEDMKHEAQVLYERVQNILKKGVR
ncbi:protease subunit of ATP-dependent Clp proteases [Bellilinea caldifistulae]|uniref:head maturation protease, ClpP-related n=1 Tax=Bellilinea caldifistulae TaxID=360411 RepID=UPI0007803C43|nr:head maturation protease, ClpP-related [Bellilinea caldifistulae]GAP11751.1 protease subunit of ATP-dependent Clp proteases [Bellilinea caldifistulae]